MELPARHMTVLHHIDELDSLTSPVVLAIGMFDGVHAGHQEVIATALRRASAVGGTMVLLTFDPHPVRVLRPEAPLKLLCSTEHQLRLLSRLKVGTVLLCSFDQQFARTPAEDFVRALNAACKRLDSIFVGDAWRFGAGRRGDVALLQSEASLLGFHVFGVPQVLRDGRPVSSTRVRQALERGDLAEVRALLGRDHSVLGPVVSGRKLGRTIQFPTANVEVQNEQLPPVGVYAVRALIGDEWRDGVANLGLRPTVVTDAFAPSLEVHVFDFDGDLYGQLLEVRFSERLRDEQKFDSLDALRSQIAADAALARSLLEARA